MAGETKNVKGIVLNTYDYSDSSRIVEIFSLQEGPLTCMAKGARRNKSKLLNLTQTFVEGSFQLAGGRTMYYLREGQIEDAHLGLRRSIAHMACAGFITEITGSVLFSEADANLFYLLQAGLGSLEACERSQMPRLVAAFLLKLSSFLGFRPRLGSCVICGQRPEGWAWDPEAGGVVCTLHQLPGSTSLDKQEYRELLDYIRLPLKDIIKQKCRIDPSYMSRLSYRYFLHHADIRHPKSYTMMQDLGIL